MLLIPLAADRICYSNDCHAQVRLQFMAPRQDSFHVPNLHLFQLLLCAPCVSRRGHLIVVNQSESALLYAFARARAQFFLRYQYSSALSFSKPPPMTGSRCSINKFCRVAGGQVRFSTFRPIFVFADTPAVLQTRQSPGIRSDSFALCAPGATVWIDLLLREMSEFVWHNKERTFVWE